MIASLIKPACFPLFFIVITKRTLGAETRNFDLSEHELIEDYMPYADLGMSFLMTADGLADGSLRDDAEDGIKEKRLAPVTLQDAELKPVENLIKVSIERLPFFSPKVEYRESRQVYLIDYFGAVFINGDEHQVLPVILNIDKLLFFYRKDGNSKWTLLSRLEDLDLQKVPGDLMDNSKLACDDSLVSERAFFEVNMIEKLMHLPGYVQVSDWNVLLRIFGPKQGDDIDGDERQEKLDLNMIIQSEIVTSKLFWLHQVPSDSIRPFYKSIIESVEKPSWYSVDGWFSLKRKSKSDLPGYLEFVDLYSEVVQSNQDVMIFEKFELFFEPFMKALAEPVSGVGNVFIGAPEDEVPRDVIQNSPWFDGPHAIIHKGAIELGIVKHPFNKVMPLVMHAKALNKQGNVIGALFVMTRVVLRTVDLMFTLNCDWIGNSKYKREAEIKLERGKRAVFKFAKSQIPYTEQYTQDPLHLLYAFQRFLITKEFKNA